jgi:ketosteroid isomerase-like protein
MSEENRQLVSDLYEFANKGDFVKVGDVFAADNVLIHAPGHPLAGSWIGPAATAASGQFYQALGVTGFTLRTIATDGPHRVITLADLHGTDGDDQPWSTSMVESLWVENGKIAEVRVFVWDLRELDAVLATRGIENFRRDVLEK